MAPAKSPRRTRVGIRRFRALSLALCTVVAAMVLPSPAGAATVTEFSDGIAAGSGPTGITAGPDGNVWFTEQFGNRIGRITPAGVVTEFSDGLSDGSLYLRDIAAGPDGNLWFTEIAAIGRITPAGVITEFSAGITPGGGQIRGIAAGPDDNLWFARKRLRVGGFFSIEPCGTCGRNNRRAWPENARNV